MRKAQIISMDFILTFMIYIFSLSVFFFALKESYFSSERELDMNAELVFSKLSNVYDEDYAFLKNSKIRQDFDGFLNVIKTNPEKAYEIYFQSFDSPLFAKIDYCVYLQKENDILKHFKANNKPEYDIYINGFQCGNNPTLNYPDAVIECRNDESIVLSKPVLYGNEIVELKVLACGERI